MKTIPVLLVFPILMVATQASADSLQMLKKAEKSRRKAEEKLGQERLSRTNQRIEWTQKIQNLHSLLAKEESKTEELIRNKTDLTADLKRIEKNKALTIRTIDSLSYALRRSSNYSGTSANLDDMNAFSQAVAAGTSERLNHINTMSSVTASTAFVLDRTGAQQSMTLIKLGAARALAIHQSSEASGLVNQTKDGKWIIGGAELSPEQFAALKKFTPGREGTLPFDIDGTLSNMPRKNADSANWLEQGGTFVWPIILVGLLGLLLLIERVFYLFVRKQRVSTIGAVERAVHRGDLDQAKAIVEAGATDLDRLLLRGLETVSEPVEVREAALEQVLLSEEPKLERSLTLLAAAAGVAPLLGLLGTVTGMIGTFDVIAQHGTGNPRLLSGGISMALITTQLGLIVAVPLLLGHAWVSRAVEKRQALLEEARTLLLTLRSKVEAK